jgi:hypothetical protein
MNRAAMLALSQIFVAIEFFKQRRQIANNALQLYFGAMHQLMALGAVPFETVHCALWTRHLDDYANRSGL